MPATGLLVNQASAMQASAVYACVKIISEDVAKSRPALFRKGNDGKRVAVTDHPVARLLRRPNSQQSWFDFCQQVAASLLLRGNGYAPILRDSRGRPQQWIPVNPDRVIVLEAVDGSIFDQVARYGLWELSVLEPLPLAVPTGRMLPFEEHRQQCPLGRLANYAYARGHRSVARARAACIAVVRKRRASGGRALDRPKADGRSGKAAQEARDDLHGGVLNHGKTAVLEQGLK
jgi:hypothetical protein